MCKSEFTISDYDLLISIFSVINLSNSFFLWDRADPNLSCSFDKVKIDHFLCFFLHINLHHLCILSIGFLSRYYLLRIVSYWIAWIRYCWSSELTLWLSRGKLKILLVLSYNSMVSHLSWTFTTLSSISIRPGISFTNKCLALASSRGFPKRVRYCSDFAWVDFDIPQRLASNFSVMWICYSEEKAFLRQEDRQRWTLQEMRLIYCRRDRSSWHVCMCEYRKILLLTFCSMLKWALWRFRAVWLLRDGPIVGYSITYADLLFL